jgi:SAM-dependent methyltransferase
MLNKHDLEQWDILNEIEYGYYYDDHYGIDEGDIEFLLSIIGKEPKNILEVCCGSGRIFIPLAKAGHNITGFDAHYGMLSRLHQKAKGLTNVKYYYADALKHEFETGFDVVLVAFNVIQNIEYIDHVDNNDPAQELADYKAAQELFISKAAKSVVQGGHLFFAFELFDRQVGENVFNREPDPEWFIDPEKIDMSDANVNIYGLRSKSIYGGGTYDPETRLYRGKSRDIDIYPPHGEKIISEHTSFKRNLTLDDARRMLTDNGLEIEQEYGGYHGEPIKENEYNGAAVFWARKI